ncbi:MAG: CotH kinase family protein, partial [Bacteroidales bacterium]|nr:CotH kinase family protein [Bacteroidales bacterium]
FYEPTPGESNITSGYSSIQQFTLQFSKEAGLYKNSIQVEISGAPDNATIYYSTDGSYPTRTSKVYTNPINIGVTTVLKARIITNDDIKGEVVTNTYIINKVTNLPIISLSTNPDNLWDYDSGIYVLGPNAQAGEPNFGANFWQDWEKPVHFEYFETDGQRKISVGAGIKIYGAWSRAHDQKSFALYARSKYGAGSFNYPFFKNKTLDQFEAIVLRNSGNDWMYTMFRDAFIVTLIDGVDHQAYQPAVIYLNGEYWGILNIREKINEHFVASNNNLEPDQIELLENNGNPIHGDANNYRNMLNFMRENDLSLDDNYKTMAQRIDINNFMKYLITEIYSNNTDWPGNNVKYWRPNMPGGRWRWILFDTDFGFGLYNPDFGYSENTLAFALEPYGPSWPNPPWSTELFRNLVKNESFKIDFINLFADNLNTILYPNNLNKRIDEYENILNDEMKYHFERWNRNIYGWYNDVDVMRNFSDYRISYMRDFIDEVFNLSGTYQLNLNVTPQGSGKILVNSISPDSYSWKGYYFKNIPIKVIAIPNPGYKFTGWEDYNDNNSIIQKAFSSSTYLTAKFEKENNETLFNIVINEINYNSVSFFDSDDWIELYNNGSYTVDISGWLFKDGDNNHIFQIPNNTYLLPKKYLVISRNYNVFRQFFPQVESIIGDFSFGLSNNGDTVRLFDSNNNLVDFVAYDVDLPWPLLANGTGASIELINPILDNNIGENWTNSENYGTPGHSNDPSLSINEIITQKIEYKIYPNPFSQSTTISFYLKERNYVKIVLYNIQGKLINILDEGVYETGNYSIPLKVDENSIKPGIYLIKLQIGDQVSTSKVIYDK